MDNKFIENQRKVASSNYPPRSSNDANIRMSELCGLGVAIAHMVVFSRADYDKDLSAVDGINCVSIPVLVISAEEDSFYGKKSPIYERQNEIMNPNCSFVLMD